MIEELLLPTSVRCERQRGSYEQEEKRMTRILMHGCNGKMGRMITELVKNDDSAVITAGVDTYTGIPNDYPVFETVSQCDVEADVVIDFSNAGAMDELLDYCAEKKLPVVLCTTGLSEEQLEKVEKTSEKTAVLKSANMSLGINLLLKLLKDAAKVIGNAGYDIELVERHHNQKGGFGQRGAGRGVPLCI